MTLFQIRSLVISLLHRISFGVPIAVVLFISLPTSPATAAPLLEVHFINVGQGDAFLIRSPSGKVALIDMGPPSKSMKLIRYLRQQKVKRINLLMVTHPHLDHIGAARPLLRAFPVNVYIDPGYPYSSRYYRSLLRTVKRLGIKRYRARAGQILDMGRGLRLRVLAPFSTFLTHTRSDANSNSLVVRLEYQRLRILFMGDSEEPTEAKLMKTSPHLRSHILKVAHHGGRHSTSDHFIRAVRPRFAVISCSKHNRYGHPSPETLRRLRTRSVSSLVTSKDGHIIARSNGRTLWMSTRGKSRFNARYTVKLKRLINLKKHAQSQFTMSQDGSDQPNDSSNTGSSSYHPSSTNSSKSPLGQQPEKTAWLRLRPMGREVTVAPITPSPNGYTAARRSRYFHRHSCYFAHLIPKKEKIHYHSRYSALRSRRLPASDCHP